MQVGVEHSETIGIAEEILEDVVNKLVWIESSAFKSPDSYLVACLHCAEVIEHIQTIDELDNQSAARNVLGKYFRHALMPVPAGVSAVLLHVARLSPVIEFLSGPGDKLSG